MEDKRIEICDKLTTIIVKKNEEIQSLKEKLKGHGHFRNHTLEETLMIEVRELKEKLSKQTHSAQFRRVEMLQEKLKEAEDRIKQIHKDYGCEIRDPNGTIWEHASNLQQKLSKYEKEKK